MADLQGEVRCITLSESRGDLALLISWMYDSDFEVSADNLKPLLQMAGKCEAASTICVMWRRGLLLVACLDVPVSTPAGSCLGPC